MENSTRRKWVKAAESLISFDRDIKEIREELASFPGDCEEELVIFCRTHALSILKRYLEGNLEVPPFFSPLRA